MSLKVWLPLNGNVENQGASKYQFINRNVTFSNDGKIGQCAEFNGSNACIYTDDFSLDNEWSYSLWFYDYTREVDWTIVVMLNETGSDADTQFSFWYHNNSSWIQSTANTQYNSRITAPTKDTWHHFCATFNGSTLLTYIDGSLINTKAITTAHTPKTHLSIGARRSGTSSWSNYWKGKINDFRIYNHCLSPAEVHEISQGLVLHYKLDGFQGGYGNPNLALGSQTLLTTAAVSNTYISKRGAATLGTRDGFAQVNGTAAWQGFSLWANSLNLQVGTTYTYSFYAYTALSTSTNAGISFYPMMYNSAGTRDTTSKLPISVMGGAFTEVNAKQIGTLSTTPKLYWATFTWNQTMANILTNSGKIELSIQIHGTFNEGRIDYLWAPKLEIGNAPTSWSPAASEGSLNIIQDSSGYNHNGSILGNPIISSDTARYVSSTSFPANADGILSTYPLTLWNNAFTYSFWIKPSGENGGRSIYAASYSGTSCSIEKTTGNKLRFYWNGSPDLSTSSLTITDGIWQHIAIVKEENKTTIKCYYNGVLKDTFTNTFSDKTFSGNLRIARDTRGDATSYTGLMSDFRIYCTALDADAIRQLYEVGAKIDKNGNWHTFEFKETNSIAKIKKTGITEANEVYDNIHFNNRAQIIKHNAVTLMLSNLDVVTTYSSTIKTGTINSIPAATMQTLAGKTLRLIYDVCTTGARYSAEQGQTAYNYVRYGIHGSMGYVNGSGTSGTHYPFAGELGYSGDAKHIIQTWTVPTGYTTYNNLNFAIQDFDKPASTNNTTWFIKNVRLEVVEGTSDNITGTNLIEL